MTITFGSTQANQIVANDKQQISRYGRIVHRTIYNRPAVVAPEPTPEPLTGTAVPASPTNQTAEAPITPSSTAVPVTCEFCPKPATYVWQRDRVRLLCGRCFWNRLRAYMQLQGES